MSAEGATKVTEARGLSTAGIPSTTIREANPVEFDEANLANKSIGGDEAAFEKLYTHYYPRVRALCIRKIGSVHLAEEIAQEAFARAFERISEFGGPRHFGGWVGTIAANLCTDHLRRKKPVASVDQMMEIESGIPSYEVDLIKNVRRDDTSKLVKAAMQRLEPRQQQALLMHEVNGLSCAKVGEALGISEVAAESLLARARRRLRKEITAKAVPADLFGVGGVLLLPALGRALRKVKADIRMRAASLSYANENTGIASGPILDTAKAFIVVLGTALAASFVSESVVPTLEPGTGADTGAVTAASVDFITVDADLPEAGPADGRYEPVFVDIDLDPRDGGMGVSGGVDFPGPSSGGAFGINYHVGIEQDANGSVTSTRVVVRDSSGENVVDTGEINHRIDSSN